MHLHDGLWRLGFDIDSYRVETGHLQAFNGVSADVKNTVLALSINKTVVTQNVT